MRLVARFQIMPTFEELLDCLNAPEAKPKRSQARRIFHGLFLFSLFVTLTIWALIFFKVGISNEVAYVGIGAVVVASVSWAADLALSISKQRDIFLNPAKILTRDLDVEHSRERFLARQLVNFGGEVLATRLNRLESQLHVHEKWIDITRLVGLLGPAMLFATKYIGWEGPIQDTIQWIGGAFLSGSILGSILLRSGLRRMQRVGFVLKMAAETRSPQRVRRSSYVKRSR